MKTITEAEAQEYANKWRVWIAVDSFDENELDCACWYTAKPILCDRGCWKSDYPSDAGSCPFRIASDRPWTEQIWRPE